MSDIRYEVNITTEGSAIISRIEGGYRYVCDEIIPIEHRPAVALALLGKTREQLMELVAEAIEEKHLEASMDWGIDGGSFATVVLAAIFGDAGRG